MISAGVSTSPKHCEILAGAGIAQGCTEHPKYTEHEE
jgi:hypothetical protein